MKNKTSFLLFGSVNTCIYLFIANRDQFIHFENEKIILDFASTGIFSVL
jgi:hypothetical protein